MFSLELRCMFTIRFNLDIDDADEKNKLISQLHKILRPFMLRRLKVDVEKSLPPKTETILFTGMSAMQKKLYRDILMRDIDTLTGKSAVTGGGGGSRTAVLNIVMQLRKCAGHPYLFPGVEDRSLPPLGEHLVENCGKMVLLDKLLLRLKERGHRVLLFTQMTRILDILEDYMVRIVLHIAIQSNSINVLIFNFSTSEDFNTVALTEIPHMRKEKDALMPTMPLIRRNSCSYCQLVLEAWESISKQLMWLFYMILIG